jgi:hypothetical protein
VILLVNGAAVDVEAWRHDPRLGVLLTPNSHNSVARAVSWDVPLAIDNGAFSGFDADAFRGLLVEAAAVLPRMAQPSDLLWVVAPDVVGDATATRLRFDEWEPQIRAAGLPVAYAAQDGQLCADVPWDSIAGLFVGGTDAYKLSPESAALCRDAKERDKLVHVGRVNSKLRMAAAHAMGADTVDGSQFSWWPRRYIPRGLRWIRQIEAEAEAAEEQHSFHLPPHRERVLARARAGGVPGPLGQPRRRTVIHAPLFGGA